MTTEQWLILGSYLITAIIGLLNFWSKISKPKSEQKLDEGQGKINEATYNKILNEAVALANERALKSEKEAVVTEERFDEREKRLTKRIDDLESKLNLALQENITLKSEMAEMHMKQAMSDRQIAEQGMAQLVSQRLIEEQRREIIALQDFSERLIGQVVEYGGNPVEYKPLKDSTNLGGDDLIIP
jgi:major membrane immunogen (membrane-anchored lipoprotein)